MRPLPNITYIKLLSPHLLIKVDTIICNAISGHKTTQVHKEIIYYCHNVEENIELPTWRRKYKQES